MAPTGQTKRPRRSVLLWEDEDDPDESASATTSDFIEESSWISPYKHCSPNEVEVYFKAGSKDYALAGKGEDNKLKISPIQLKKKYR